MTTPKPQSAAPFSGILQYKVFGLPVNREVMFSNHKDQYKPRVEKRQRHLMTKISFLRYFLEPDEGVLLVATGHSPPTVLEKLGIGWLFVYLKRSILVFTDRRIFHVPTTSVYKYRNSIAQIRYSDCKSIHVKRSSLLVQYKGGGKTEKFFSLSRREKKKLRTLLENISLEGPKSGASGRVYLCPRCAGALLSTTSKCRSCGLGFKTGTVATVFAILFPGGGYFYLRQPFLGLVTALLEIWAALLIGIPAVDLANGAAANFLWLGSGILMLALLKTFAVAHARVLVEDYIPRRSKVSFQTVAAAKA